MVKGRSARAEEAAARRTLYYGGVFALRGRRQCLGGVGCLACLSRNIKKAQPGAVLVNSTEWRVLLVHCVLLVLLSQGSLRCVSEIKSVSKSLSKTNSSAETARPPALPRAGVVLLQLHAMSVLRVADDTGTHFTGPTAHAMHTTSAHRTKTANVYEIDGERRFLVLCHTPRFCRARLPSLPHAGRAALSLEETPVRLPL